MMMMLMMISLQREAVAYLCGLMVMMVMTTYLLSPAHQFAVQLHPSWRCPGRSQDGQLGLELLHLGQHVRHGAAAIAEAEALEVLVLPVAVGVVVGVGGQRRQVRGADGVAQQREVGALRRHELFEQLGPLVRGERVDDGHGRVGHGGAEARDLLAAAGGRVVDAQLPLRGAGGRRSGAFHGGVQGAELVLAVGRGAEGLGAGLLAGVQGMAAGDGGDAGRIQSPEGQAGRSHRRAMLDRGRRTRKMLGLISSTPSSFSLAISRNQGIHAGGNRTVFKQAGNRWGACPEGGGAESELRLGRCSKT